MGTCAGEGDILDGHEAATIDGNAKICRKQKPNHVIWCQRAYLENKSVVRGRGVRLLGVRSATGCTLQLLGELTADSPVFSKTTFCTQLWAVWKKYSAFCPVSLLSPGHADAGNLPYNG